MNGNIWIMLGVLAGAFSIYAINHGYHLKSKESTERIIAEIRKTAADKTTSNQVAIFQQIKNKFVFQSANPEQNPIPAPSSTKKEAKIIFNPHTFIIDNSQNISSITDNALGDVSVVFEEDFPNKNYYVNITGDKTITYEIITKEKSHIRIKFKEDDLEMVQVVCKE